MRSSAARDWRALGWWLFIGLLAVCAAELGAYFWVAA